MERIERHDVMNAVGLAAVLLVMALGLLLGTRALFGVINDGLISSEKTEDSVVAAGDTEEATSTDEDTEATTPTTEPEPTTSLHTPGEVTTRVGNGAQRNGIAASGTALLSNAGYLTLAGKNATATSTSIVYYAEGYEADAAQVARLLGVAESSIAPMIADPGGVPVDGAQIVAVLGSDTTVG